MAKDDFWVVSGYDSHRAWFRTEAEANRWRAEQHDWKSLTVESYGFQKPRDEARWHTAEVAFSRDGVRWIVWRYATHKQEPKPVDARFVRRNEWIGDGLGESVEVAYWVATLHVYAMDFEAAEQRLPQLAAEILAGDRLVPAYGGQQCVLVNGVPIPPELREQARAIMEGERIT